MILVDTGPLVALCDGRDSRHRSAARDLQNFGAARLCTCEAVLVEACFHLPHRAQRQRLRALLEHLDIESVEGTHDEGFWSDVFDWLLKYADHEPDWADGCLAVLSGRSQRLKISWNFCW